MEVTPVAEDEPLPEAIEHLFYSDGKFYNAMIDESVRARTKFPGPNTMLAALMEEVGELAKALMEESDERVREEAVQVAVMALRIGTEGDVTHGRKLKPWKQGK